MDQYKSVSEIINKEITNGKSIKYSLKKLNISKTPTRDVSKKFDTSLNLDFINIPKRSSMENEWKPKDLYKYIYNLVSSLTRGLFENKEEITKAVSIDALM